MSKKTSKWPRRDLVRKFEALGLPVTAVQPRQITEEGITEWALFRGRMIEGRPLALRPWAAGDPSRLTAGIQRALLHTALDHH